MCLPHFPSITTFNDTVEWLGVRSWTTASIASRRMLRRKLGPGIVGPDAKTIGPRLAQRLSSLRGAQLVARADTRLAR